MSPAQAEALLRRNAASCERAKAPRCTCRCGGALHGKAHSEQWIEGEMWAQFPSEGAALARQETAP